MTYRYRICQRQQQRGRSVELLQDLLYRIRQCCGSESETIRNFLLDPNSNSDSDPTIRGDGKNESICCNYHKQNHKSGHYAGKNFNLNSRVHLHEKRIAENHISISTSVESESES
jgi:hypothetical protein